MDPTSVWAYCVYLKSKRKKTIIESYQWFLFQRLFVPNYLCYIFIQLFLIATVSKWKRIILKLFISKILLPPPPSPPGNLMVAPLRQLRGYEYTLHYMYLTIESQIYPMVYFLLKYSTAPRPLVLNKITIGEWHIVYRPMLTCLMRRRSQTYRSALGTWCVLFFSHFHNSPGRVSISPGQDTNLPRQDTNSPGRDTNSPGQGTNSPGRDRPLTRPGEILTRLGEILPCLGKILTCPGDIGY